MSNYFQVRASFETVDNRRHKVYQKICRLEIAVPMIPAVESGLEVPRSPQHILNEEIHNRLGTSATLEGDWMRGSGWCVWLSTFSPADKPSSIATDETVRGQLPSDAVLIAGVQAAHSAATERYSAMVREAKLNRQTAMLLSEFLEDMEKKSKEVCRFTQRLAGLTAELIAETAIQTRQGREGFIADVRKQMAEDPKVAELISEESLGRFDAMCIDFVEKNRSNGLPRGLGTMRCRDAALEFVRERSPKKE